VIVVLVNVMLVGAQTPQVSGHSIRWATPITESIVHKVGFD
jgi:hypothetical protein